jgi:AcrR family transcriptional regulator
MATDATVKKLIVVAERLYAERGIDRVSLRQIAEEAGQRNPAVVQYHFGTREDLWCAILVTRRHDVDAHRLARLDALEADGATRDLHRLVEASVLPVLESQPPGSYYVRFLAALQSRWQLYRLQRMLPPEARASGERLARHLRGALDHLSPVVRDNRLSVGFDMTLHALAGLQRQVADGENLLAPDLFVDDLIVSMVAFLGAPEPAPASTSEAVQV